MLSSPPLAPLTGNYDVDLKILLHFSRVGLAFFRCISCGCRDFADIHDTPAVWQARIELRASALAWEEIKLERNDTHNWKLTLEMLRLDARCLSFGEGADKKLGEMLGVARVSDLDFKLLVLKAVKADELEIYKVLTKKSKPKHLHDVEFVAAAVNSHGNKVLSSQETVNKLICLDTFKQAFKKALYSNNLRALSYLIEEKFVLESDIKMLLPDHLSYVARFGKPGIIKFLFGHKLCSPLSKTRERGTMLALVAKRGHVGIFKYFLEHEEVKKLEFLEFKSQTLLAECATEGHINIARLILDDGRYTTKSTSQAAISACKNGRIEFVRFLLERNLQYTSTTGISCLKATVKHDHTEIVKILLQHPDVRIPAPQFKVLRSLARDNGNLELAEEFHKRSY